MTWVRNLLRGLVQRGRSGWGINSWAWLGGGVRVRAVARHQMARGHPVPGQDSGSR
jgi:hypothetical protein